MSSDKPEKLGHSETKLKVFLLLWWLLALLGPTIIKYFKLDYDGRGIEGVLWFLFFLISFPFGISGELVSSLFSFAPEPVKLIISLLLGTFSFIGFYWLVVLVKSFVRKRRDVAGG